MWVEGITDPSAHVWVVGGGGGSNGQVLPIGMTVPSGQPLVVGGGHVWVARITVPSTQV